MRRTRPGAALAALAFALVLATTAALASSTTITRADAPAIAKAIQLRPGDLPGYGQQPNPFTPQEEKANTQAAKCDGGVSSFDALINAPSAYFLTKTAAISSFVEIFSSARLAAQDVAASGSSRGVACALRVYAKQIKASAPKGETISLSSIGRLPSIVSGIAGATAYRLVLVAHAKQGNTEHTVTSYSDYIAFAYRQVEVDLSAAFHVTPPPTLERKLTLLLLQRTKAAAS
jgi:hypothetical protein